MVAASSQVANDHWPDAVRSMSVPSPCGVKANTWSCSLVESLTWKANLLGASYSVTVCSPATVLPRNSAEDV